MRGTRQASRVGYRQSLGVSREVGWGAAFWSLPSQCHEVEDKSYVRAQLEALALDRHRCYTLGEREMNG